MPIIIIITILLFITFVTTAVYCYCKGCSIRPDNRASKYHRVSYTKTIHHCLHSLPIVQPVSIVAKVTLQVTIKWIETPVQSMHKTSKAKKSGNCDRVLLYYQLTSSRVLANRSSLKVDSTSNKMYLTIT